MKGQNDPRYGFICEGVAEQLKAMGDNERGSVLSEPGRKRNGSTTRAFVTCSAAAISTWRI